MGIRRNREAPRRQLRKLGISAAVGLGAAIPLLLAVIAGATWLASWRLRTLRLTSDD